MNLLSKIIIVILILVFLICITFINIENNENKIDKWATNNGYVIQSKEMHLTIIGTPFYYLNKGQYIYEVKLTNGDTWWVRTDIFGNDYEKQ